jgi:SAM-dependent methyltransferase
MTTAVFSRERTCPVCGGASNPLLALDDQPIYQHPIPSDARVPEPHSTNLLWISCVRCSHAWQPDFDKSLLERIYESHYYTPAPSGVGVKFRNAFIKIVEQFGLVKPCEVLLEIGAADGDVLAELRRKTAAGKAYAFEPNKENAAVARGRGLEVKERFFGDGKQGEELESADFIYARHVIEHVFDFAKFFAAINAAAKPLAQLVLETPSLDFHAENGSLAPFHIEHVHVFSLLSLATLAGKHGWQLTRSETTEDGNLVAAFERLAAPGSGVFIDQIPASTLGKLQSMADSCRSRVRSLVQGRRVIVWGAGSAGVNVVKMMGREPDFWTDGNANKFGKSFAGLRSRVVSPERALADAEADATGNFLLIVASTFVSEIVPRIQELGWSKEVFDMMGNRLSEGRR